LLPVAKREKNLAAKIKRFNFTEKIRSAIEDVVASSETRNEPSSENKKIQIKFEPKEGQIETDIFIDADKARIYQVIINCFKTRLKL
jgi:signal transduction histidine kinase